MSKFTKVSIAAAVVLFLAIGVPWCMSQEAQGSVQEITQVK